MTILEKKAAREQAINEMKELNKIENRSLTSAEESQYNAAKGKVEKLTREIETEEIENRSAQPPMNGIQTPRQGGSTEGVSLRSLLNDARNNPQKGVEIPVENRSLVVNTGEGITPLVRTENRSIIEDLQEELLVGALGVDFQGGLIGMQEQPIIGNATAEFLSENGELSASDVELNKDVLRPKRLAVMIEVSDQLLTQDSQGVEAKLQKILTTAIARGIEKKLFSNDVKTDNSPAGLMALSTPVEKGVDATHGGIVELETVLSSANALAGNLAYISNSVGIGDLKCIEKNQNRFLLEGGIMNEYKTLRSNFLPANLGEAANEYPVIFGDWASLQIAQWGALKITLDPYTGLANNKVRFVAQTYVDFAPKYLKSFAYATFTK